MAPRRRPDDDEMRSHEAALREAGDERRSAKEAHDEAVDKLADAVGKARRAGVPIKTIERCAGIKKQWMYELTRYKGRE